jgi:hypothetical protein
MNGRRLKIQKCVFRVSKLGKTFHYWRVVKNFGGSGLFSVEETYKIGDSIFNGGTMFFHNKKELFDWDDIAKTIEGEEKLAKRNWRLERILSV